MNIRQTIRLAALAAALPLALFGAMQNHPQVLFAGDYADPSILRDGEDYYFTYSSLCYSPGLEIWHSKNLKDWEFVSYALKDYKFSVWAPELVKHNGRYFIYYPASVGGVFAVWADKMEGPWSAPVDIGIPSYAIDPGHVVGEDGKRYIFTNGGMMYPLSDDGLKITGEGRQVYGGWKFPEDWNTEGNDTPRQMYLESPKLFRRGEYYYLVCAEGGTAGPATSHMCVAARSRSVFGPWENSPYNPFVHTFSAEEPWWSIGHGTMIDDTEGNWYCVYHGYMKELHTLGRFALIEQMEWTDDGWFKAKAIDEGQAEKQAIPYSHAPRFLSWKGNPNISMCMAPGPKYSFEADVELSGDGKGGLLLFYDDNHYAGVLATKDEIFIHSESWEKKTIPNTFGEKFHVKLAFDHNRLTAEVNGNNLAPTPIDVSQLNHNRLGSFISLRPAQWADNGRDVKFKNVTLAN